MCVSIMKDDSQESFGHLSDSAPLPHHRQNPLAHKRTEAMNVTHAVREMQEETNTHTRAHTHEREMSLSGARTRVTEEVMLIVDP